MAERAPSFILHVFVVGFHHQKGSTVEFSWPPLAASPASPTTESITSLLPREWRHLPHLALPDGCHNYDEDSVFFSLPGRSPRERCVYGVACCRQIDSKDLRETNDEVTRSTVQKSVCVLSRIPTYGFIEAKIKLVTHAYFNSKDFSDTSILIEAFASLNSSEPTDPLAVVHVGLSQRNQITFFQHRILQVLKALLLQKRVLVYGAPVHKLSNTVLSIAAFFPKCLEHLVYSSVGKNDNCGFPLLLCSSGSLLQPYMCLQQMDMLADKNSEGLLAGVVNPLFEKQHTKFCDLFLDMNSGLVTINSQELKSSLHLTSADLRFCSILTDCIQSTVPSEEEAETAHYSDWHGSNEWVQAQFKLYLLSLLATSLSGDSMSMDEFNPEFMATWLQSPVYLAWKEGGAYDGLARVEAKHVCEGELSMGDLKRRLRAQVSDYGLVLQSNEQVVHAVEQTGKILSQTAGSMSHAVSSAWNTASSALYSWWGTGPHQEPPAESEAP